MAGDELIQAARAAGARHLDEKAGKALLAGFGLDVPRSTVVAGPQDVAAAIAGFAPPLVVKVVSPDILHKSDVGGVRLRLGDAAAVATAISEMAKLDGIRQAKVDGWLVEEMAPAGQELVVGAFQDPRFGPMVMLGLGGIFVEILRDVAFRICPITRDDAQAMLRSLKGYALLAGARGGTPLDREAIVDALMAIGGPDGVMARHGSDIAELDINPLIVSAKGARAVDARVILSAGATAKRTDNPSGGSALAHLRPLFAPRTVAVVGASTKGAPMPNTFIRRMKAFGYDGEIYPIHPQATEIEGLRAYPSLASTPKPIDYAYIAIGAERIPALLAEAKGRVAIAQVISSGFGEVEGGAALESELIAAARTAGVRIVGPNCLGTYAPRGKLTFPDNAPQEPGCIGLIAQSGGLTTNMIKRGQFRGLRFSGAVTAGNCADIGPADLLDYYLSDPDTQAIGCYLEELKDGRRFFELLRSAAARKPVVLLRGGRSRQGRLAAASHTGALAEDSSGWAALCAQTPSVEAATLDEFVDTLLALQFLKLRPERPTRNVVLFGNGGGSSVLGTDFMADLGLDVSPFPKPILQELETLRLLPGSSVANPIDTPVATLQEQNGLVAQQILDIVLSKAPVDAIAMHLNMSSFSGRGGGDPIDQIFTFLDEAMQRHAGTAHLLLAFRTDDDPVLEERKRTYRERARRMGIPMFDEIPQLAKALAAVAQLEARLGQREGWQ